MTPYKIDVRFQGGTASQRAIVMAAKARIERVIVEELPLAQVGSETTTGLIIDFHIEPIDGPRGILGQAGPVRLRASNLGRHSFLPSYGVMTFDSADVNVMEADGTLRDVVTHEMLHVVGVGTIWREKGRLAGAGTDRPRFLGPRAAKAYTALLPALSGLTAVPVENGGGSGTRDSHWSERALSNELMTGYVSPSGVTNPFSAITVGSLMDLGYTVDLNAAEAYALPSHVEMLESSAPVERPHCVSPGIPEVDPDVLSDADAEADLSGDERPSR